MGLHYPIICHNIPSYTMIHYNVPIKGSTLVSFILARAQQAMLGGSHHPGHVPSDKA